ncbi:hypothetical protein SAMN06295905_1422 [Devosia lucknowensis]|uniref:Uncharacterized protein n=1 Tax=Devosia lucknowensis TaxID=1096929 RepID=A0A1Y6EV89_9HYPH|nr:hypothetical protein [Devosia lucknowensis]SMQ66206.1 hypothetical protein SAMN06295905_1422 [Devosia lucknowensis]
MNVANLQLEGLYLAVAAINDLLVRKGVVSREDVDLALRRAEQTALGDYRTEELSPAERDAVALAARILAAANNGVGDGFVPPFSELARQVGRTKDSFPDQA